MYLSLPHASGLVTRMQGIKYADPGYLLMRDFVFLKKKAAGMH